MQTTGGPRTNEYVYMIAFYPPNSYLFSPLGETREKTLLK